MPTRVNLAMKIVSSVLKAQGSTTPIVQNVWIVVILSNLTKMEPLSANKYVVIS